MDDDLFVSHIYLCDQIVEEKFMWSFLRQFKISKRQMFDRK